MNYTLSLKYVFFFYYQTVTVTCIKNILRRNIYIFCETFTHREKF